MSKQAGAGQVESGIIVDQRELKAAIREYFTTPEELRGGVNTLGQLARHVGCEVRDIQLVMSQNPDMAGEILQSVALAGAVQIPRVLYKLMEAVEAGSVKAAEIYLDFTRKTIQDPLIANMAKRSTEELTKVMRNVGDQVDMLLSAASQPDAEAARRRLRDPVDRSAKGSMARALVALETDHSIPKVKHVEAQT